MPATELRTDSFEVNISAPAVSTGRVVVIDAEKGDTLFEKNADERGPVASTQKLLTALIVAQAGGFDSPVGIVEKDTDCMAVKCGLKPGEAYSRGELLTALLLTSANDAALALARDHSGSVEAFGAAMNLRASQLGMQASHFTNPHGLPDDRQFSTARDMSRLARAVDAIPLLREMMRRPFCDWKRNDGTTSVLTNTNRLLTDFPSCDGMKTGFTKAAGHCLISSAGHDGCRRIVVMLNSTSEDVWKDSRAMLEWSLRQNT